MSRVGVKHLLGNIVSGTNRRSGLKEPKKKRYEVYFGSTNAVSAATKDKFNFYSEIPCNMIKMDSAFSKKSNFAVFQALAGARAKVIFLFFFVVQPSLLVPIMQHVSFILLRSGFCITYV